ncbi:MULTISPECIES: gas vesicle protein [Streptomyces]|uniref:gas vesicle protein n=1 Tax=Streptomyces TaxID=1883 RepID=UPI000AA3F8AA
MTGGPAGSEPRQAGPAPVPEPRPDPVEEYRDAVRGREVSLVDLLDRLLGTGVVVSGSLTLGIAGVDLVRVDLRALLSSVNDGVPSPWRGGGPL